MIQLIKRTVLLQVLLSTLAITLNAQFLEKNYIYISGCPSTGTHFGVEYNLNYIYNNRISVKAGYSALLKKANSLPDDYKKGVVWIPLPTAYLDPMDSFETYQLLFGWVLPVKSNYKIRFNFMAGLGYTFIQEASNWTYEGYDGWSSNYTYDFVDHQRLSFIFQPMAEFTFKRTFGITVSPVILVNEKTFYAGLNWGLMMGVVRGKRVK